MQPHTHATGGRSSAKGRALFTAGALSLMALVAAPAVEAERLSDKDVKSLIERIDHERDRFEDQLDGKLKRSILRGAGGEVNVERYLDDLQENVNKLKERFTSAYSASAEVTTVLRQGSDIQRFMSSQPPDLDGASEWNRLAASLASLASAYGAAMPLGEGRQARRLNDREVRLAADAVAETADRFKKNLDASLKNDKTVDKPGRDAAVREADALKQEAKKLSSALGDGRPASGEAKALLDRVAKIRASSSGRTLSPAAQKAWSAVESEIDKIAQGFNFPAKPGE
jgi:hypothetical protein